MKILTAITGFVLVTAVVSCKKDNDKKADCRIVTVTQTTSSGTIISNLTYNNDGRISTITTAGSNGSTKVFTYLGNTIIATTSNADGSFSSSDSITLDAKRRPLNIRQFFNEDKTGFTNFSFEYSGDDLLKVHQTGSTQGNPNTSVATSKNGNMISLTDASGSTNLEYFTDKKVQQGDYLELSTFLQYGITVYPHKNLLKSLSNNSSVLNFNYEFGNDGLITQATATGGSSIATISYQYGCK